MLVLISYIYIVDNKYINALSIIYILPIYHKCKYFLFLKIRNILKCMYIYAMYVKQANGLVIKAFFFNNKKKNYNNSSVINFIFAEYNKYDE